MATTWRFIQTPGTQEAPLLPPYISGLESAPQHRGSRLIKLDFYDFSESYIFTAIFWTVGVNKDMILLKLA